MGSLGPTSEVTGLLQHGARGGKWATTARGGGGGGAGHSDQGRGGASGLRSPLTNGGHRLMAQIGDQTEVKIQQRICVQWLFDYVVTSCYGLWKEGNEEMMNITLLGARS